MGGLPGCEPHRSTKKYLCSGDEQTFLENKARRLEQRLNLVGHATSLAALLSSTECTQEQLRPHLNVFADANFELPSMTKQKLLALRIRLIVPRLVDEQSDALVDEVVQVLNPSRRCW